MALLESLHEFTYLILFIFLVSIFLKYLLFHNNKAATKIGLKLPPSPSKLPIIGNLHQLGTKPHISLRDLSQKYGPIFYMQLGHIPTVIVSSPKVAEEVYKTHDLVFSNRPQIIAAKYLFYNCKDIGFSQYGSYWRYVRKISNLELLSSRKVQYYSHVREKEVARLVRRLSESYPGTVNLSKMLGLYANDVVCKVVFGRDFSEGGDYDKQGFQELLEEFQELLGGLGVSDFFPSLEFVISLTGMKSRLIHTFKQFDELFDRIIGEHLDRHGHDRVKDERSKDLVDGLLDIQRNNGSSEMTLSMENVKAIILDMFAAGTDTTFISLDWGMTELIINPKALQKAQTEIQSVLGERRVVLESDLPQLNYIKAVIKETYRLHPPAPVLMPRESIEHVVINGYDIPAKTRLFVNAWAMGRDPEIWEDPETFRPERFLQGTPIDFKCHDYELIPFGAGRRICPGMNFGIAAVELALAQLLHSFDWELPPGVTAKDLDMTEVFGITMHRKVGFVVLAKPRFP
ncbi:cytochrome P450 71AP13-like [Humulus lupulus]|uniref:cytochrome P450 71AP13-like n=1 Tax=Humulus lupulus TaxID=3486 RepID=UPI002B416A1F|nr:cytochrome P450 71AP13-like [Humulus lupulus]